MDQDIGLPGICNTTRTYTNKVKYGLPGICNTTRTYTNKVKYRLPGICNTTRTYTNKVKYGLPGICNTPRTYTNKVKYGLPGICNTTRTYTNKVKYIPQLKLTMKPSCLFLFRRSQLIHNYFKPSSSRESVTKVIQDVNITGLHDWHILTQHSIFTSEKNSHSNVVYRTLAC